MKVCFTGNRPNKLYGYDLTHSSGGTAGCIDYAIRKGKQVINLLDTLKGLKFCILLYTGAVKITY